MAAMQQFSQGATVNLSMLIDMVLQKTYHELTLLSELLPRKSDIERKIEIIQFATNTRQQFIRLLALVKWASNADKVDQCQEVSATLDQTNMFFINTADTLAKMARETLTNARLPNFSLPTAVDVLTTGSFNRLPLCIKEKIVPPDPISTSDRRRTLKRLNEIIQNRLAVSKIPTHYTSVTISEGRVRLTVQDEFQVALTLMGDQANIPWRLLTIEFLVKDFETGDGKSLVHKMQIHYIHQLLQSRLMGDCEPLVEIYDCLHYFSMSLQLEVLHTQAVRLINEKWGDLAKVDEYVTGQKLAISYWRTPQNSQNNNQAPSILIKSLGTEPSNLLLYHQPEINNDGDIFQRNAATELLPSCVAMENILTLAVHERSKSRLKVLIKTLQKEKYFERYADFDLEAPSIKIRPFDNCTESEIVMIKVDSRSGKMMIMVNERIQDFVKKNDLLRLLENDVKEFQTAFHNLRCHIFLARCTSIVSLLPVQPCFYLPFIKHEKLQKLSKNRLYLRFDKHPNHALIISVDADTDDDYRCLRDKYHIMSMTSSEHIVQRKRENSISEQEQKGKTCQNPTQSKQYFFYNPETLMTLNKDAFSSASVSEKAVDFDSSKRKTSDTLGQSKRHKKTKESCDSSQHSFSSKSQIVSMVTACNIRIPFIKVCRELSRAGIAYQIINNDADREIFIRILQLPDVENVNPKVVCKLRKLLIACTIRLSESMFLWDVEYKFSKSPFKRICEKDRSQFCISTEFNYERMDPDLRVSSENDALVEKIRKDWKALNVMYEHALILRDYLEDERGDLFNLVSVESFDFRTLAITYGETYSYRVFINWISATEEFDLDFGATGSKLERNPHQLVSRELKRELNVHKSLPYLLFIIIKTTAPLRAMCRIPTHPTLGTTMRPLLPLQNMSIVTQTSTHVRLFYRNIYVVDISFVDDGVVIRDGHFCKSDPMKQLGGIGPAENLATFLQRFADKPDPNTGTFDMEKGSRDGFQQIHNLNESPGHSFSASMRSPAFSSPSHVGAGTTSAGSYSGQLSSMSPANRYSGSSPGFIQPSPAPAQSSSMTSPASWPHSPQLSQGSPLHTKTGVLPGNVGGSDQQPASSRTANAASVVFMTTTAFARLVAPAEHEFPGYKAKYSASPLHRFFDALNLLKHLVRIVRKDDTLHLDKYDNILVFSVDSGLVYSVYVNPAHFETLHLDVTTKQGFENFWTQDELRILKQFFEVVVTPCKLNMLTAFARLLGADSRILKDAIKVMRIEMQPDQKQKWLIEWSFMTPPAIVASIAVPGTPAVVLKAKNLFYFQLTDVNDANRRFVFSILYDTTKNIVQPTEFPHSPDLPQEPPSWAKSAREACNAYLKEIVESVSDQECRLFPTLLSLVNNFVYN